MSTVTAIIALTGDLRVAVDGVPHQPELSLTRDDLRAVIAEITCDLAAPVRVEVDEADGSRFVDIVTPSPDGDRATPDTEVDSDGDVAADAVGGSVVAAGPALAPALTGIGFIPGETVALAYLLVDAQADHAGRVCLNLPPALVAATGGQLVLIGFDSNTVTPIKPEPRVSATARRFEECTPQPDHSATTP